MIFFVFTGHYEPRTTEIRDDQAGYKLVFKVVTAVNQTDFFKKKLKWQLISSAAADKY